MNNQSTAGHLTAFLTALIWGTTFISTKILLMDFQPVEILFFRFVLGLLALLLACPRPLKGTTVRQEATFAAAGLCGICLYYLLENIALTYSRQKSNTQRLTAVLFGAFHLVVLAGRQPSCGLRGKNLSKIPR